jgi:hypothetical protein
LLEQGVGGIIVDHILERLEKGTHGFVDPRNNISILARPPLHIHALIDSIQQQLLSIAPREFLKKNLRMVQIVKYNDEYSQIYGRLLLIFGM